MSYQSYLRQSENEALTRQFTFHRRDSHLMGRQPVEPNSLVHRLPGHGTGLLNPSGSPFPDLLIHGKSSLYVICKGVLIGEDDTECGSIFNGLAGPLSLMRLSDLQHSLGNGQWVWLTIIGCAASPRMQAFPWYQYSYGW